MKSIGTVNLWIFLSILCCLYKTADSRNEGRDKKGDLQQRASWPWTSTHCNCMVSILRLLILSVFYLDFCSWSKYENHWGQRTDRNPAAFSLVFPGEPLHGYRVCIQAILQDKPKIATQNLPEVSVCLCVLQMTVRLLLHCPCLLRM